MLPLLFPIVIQFFAQNKWRIQGVPKSQLAVYSRIQEEERSNMIIYTQEQTQLTTSN